MIRLFERVCLVAALVCLSLICAVGARAQNTADVVGTVTDASGGVLPGATVTITNVETNVSQSTQTTTGGDYVFALLQVGSYIVKVEEKGFKTYSASAISLSSGDRARVDAKMEVGDVSQTVEVQATTAPALQTDTSRIGHSRHGTGRGGPAAGWSQHRKAGSTFRGHHGRRAGLDRSGQPAR